MAIELTNQPVPKSKYPLEDMELNQSFKLPFDDLSHRTRQRQSVLSCIRHYKKTGALNQDFKVQTRTIGNELWITRID